MKTVTCAYLGDYLFAAEFGERSAEYFATSLPNMEEGDEVSIEVVNLPTSIARRIVLQGLPEQHYSDGYVAAEVVAPYLTSSTY